MMNESPKQPMTVINNHLEDLYLQNQQLIGSLIAGFGTFMVAGLIQSLQTYIEYHLLQVLFGNKNNLISF